LRNFFLWLSREPGYRKAVSANDAGFFTPSEQDVRIATAKREKRVATLDEVKRVLALMPDASVIEQRNRALVAFAILTGARDGALASFRLKHVDLDARTLFQDGRDVTQRADGLILVAAVFDREGGDAHEVGEIGDLRALASLIAVEAVGVSKHIIKAWRERGQRPSGEVFFHVRHSVSTLITVLSNRLNSSLSLSLFQKFTN
jgi:hypothetical protein